MILITEPLKEGARVITGCFKEETTHRCVDCVLKTICRYKGIKVIEENKRG